MKNFHGTLELERLNKKESDLDMFRKTRTRNYLKKLAGAYHECRFPYRSYHKKNNCIFIHVPKAAGTSILWALGKKEGARDHLQWFVYYAANPAYFDAAFKFSFVRNPWARLLSAYDYLRNGGNGSGDLEIAPIIGQYENIDDFVINGLLRGVLRNHLLFLPQSEFVCKGNGDLAVDFLGRYERIDEDFVVVATQLGISPELPVLNKNKNSFFYYREQYKSQEAIDSVRQIYAQDCCVFGYEY